MSKDYYKILSVEKNATQDEIKKAFKKKALQYHPDRPGGDEAKFKEINEAFQVLGDTEKRQKYDQFGSDFAQQGGFSGGMGWEDFMNATRRGDFGNFSSGFGGIDLGEIFGDLFGFGGHGGGRAGGPFGNADARRARAERGNDIAVDLEINFEESAFGVEREVTLRKQSHCDVCAGTGSEPGSKMDDCHTCGGQGQVVQTQRTFLGAMQTVTTCPDCHGRGRKPSKKCKHCGGDGILSKTTSIKVKIPAGIDEGQSIRLTSHGEAAPHGGTSGDLYVRTHVKPSKIFRREGFDVYTDSSITYPQAVLGDTIAVPTLDGELKVVVPPGTESGQLIRLRSKGITHLGRSSRGDHYVKIKIQVPSKVSRSARKLLEELSSEL